MALTNASRLADFGTGIGTQGAILQVDNADQMVGIGTTDPTAQLEVKQDFKVGGASTITGALTVSGDLTASGNVTIGGTLTYEDVTNIDSVGIVTARAGVNVSGGQLQVGVAYSVGNAGVATAAGFVGPLTGNVTGNISGGTVAGSTGTFSGDVDIADKIVHTGDTNTAIRFPAADTVSVETAGSERLRVSSAGNVSIGNNDTPDTLLHIQGDQPKLRIESTNALSTSSGTEEIARIEFEATKSSNRNVAASMRVRQDGTWSTVDDWFSPTAIDLYTQDQSGTEITTPRLTIKSTGKVGINSSVPAALLDVQGDAIFNDRVYWKSSGTTKMSTLASNAGMNWQDSVKAEFGNSGDLKIYHESNVNYIYGGSTNFPTVFMTNATERLRIKGTGETNIGTGSTTIAKFCLTGASNGGHQIVGQASNNVAALDVYSQHGSDSNKLSFAVSDNRTGSKSNAFVVKGNGTVGIGTDIPAGNLEIDAASTTEMIMLDVSGTNFAKIGHNSSSGVAVLDVRSEGHIRFLTGGNNERLRVTSSGNVDINGTPPWSVTGGDYRNLSISGQIANSGGFLWLGNGAAATNADLALARVNICNDSTIVAQIAGSTQTSANDDGRLTFLTKATGGTLTEKVRVTAIGETRFTRGTVGGTDSIGNVSNHWWKVGTWAGTGVDDAARATLTVLGANTHNSGNPAGGETKILLSITGSTVYATYWSTTDHHEGCNGVATKYDSSADSCEVWVRYSGGYSSNCIFADVTHGYFTGTNSSTGSTNTPTGATIATSKYELRVSNGSNSIVALRIPDDGGIFLPNLLGNADAGSTVKYANSDQELRYDTSSKLLKTNITELTKYGIDTVKKLKPSTYTPQEYNKDGTITVGDKTLIGFMADEMVTEVPEVVQMYPKSTLTKQKEDTEIVPAAISYDKLTVVLTKALQEAIAEIETLKARLDAAGL